ncbi:MAG: hypothetical protein OXC26_25570 [Albidovulum sp.]|nr:hypothetical protein [Albidovulum sp.]
MDEGQRNDGLKYDTLIAPHWTGMMSANANRIKEAMGRSLDN